MNRSRYEIINNILREIKENKSKTSISYHANLNFYQLEKYLNLLVTYKLINDGSLREQKFAITHKGQEFLTTYQKLELMLET